MEAQNGYSPLLAGDDHEAIHATGAGDEGDDVKLRLLGYKQQLKRDLSVVANFSVSFSIVSVVTGVTTLFGTGLQFGGPATMVYGWPIAGAFTAAVGLAMAEICSAYPTSGGLYFWSARLCTHRRWGPFAAWLTGWFNVVGQVSHRLPALNQAMGGDHQRGLLPGAADPGDHPARHRRQERRRLPGVQVHGDRLPRRHPAQPRRHQQPPHHLPLLFRPVRRGLEHARCVCPDGCRADRCHREGQRRVRVHPLQHRQRRRHPQQLVHLCPGPAHEPVHAHRIRRLGAYDRRDEERGQERPHRHHQRHRHLHPRGLGLHPRRHLRGQGHTLPAEPRQRRRRLRHRRGVLPRLQEPLRQRRRRDRLPGGRRRRRLLLRHELRHQQLQDGLRLLQGRRHALLLRLAQGQQAGGAHQRRLALGSRRALHGAAVSGKPGGVPGHGFHRDDRAVHLVRAADPVPGDAGAQVLRAGAIQPGPLRRPGRLGRRALGGHHHRALLAAGHVPGHQGHAQLHPRRRRRPPLPRPRVLAAQRQALVQGPRHQSGRMNMYNWTCIVERLAETEELLPTTCCNYFVPKIN
uniref:Amino-acid permease BAT1 n=1 Tax=Zea mays TaxID=4577 RepID=A0A804NHV0_MAIZE|eukprot:XP_008672188.1 uncharacterized protein LOC100193963 isoform X2 [Zea mays]